MRGKWTGAQHSCSRWIMGSWAGCSQRPGLGWGTTLKTSLWAMNFHVSWEQITGVTYSFQTSSMLRVTHEINWQEATSLLPLKGQRRHQYRSIEPSDGINSKTWRKIEFMCIHCILHTNNVPHCQHITPKSSPHTTDEPSIDAASLYNLRSGLSLVLYSLRFLTNA